MQFRIIYHYHSRHSSHLRNFEVLGEFPDVAQSILGALRHMRASVFRLSHLCMRELQSIHIRKLLILPPESDGRIASRDETPTFIIHMGSANFHRRSYMTKEQHKELVSLIEMVKRSIKKNNEEQERRCWESSDLSWDKSPIEKLENLTPHETDLLILGGVYTIRDLVTAFKECVVDKIHGIGPEIRAHIADSLAEYRRKKCPTTVP